ncbi:alpha/beta hydrolase [Pseudonocardia sp. KRD291]|uniref:alpha/beta hydrolase n=1 Tax=Pseudonocardia sp. KRD291 TaxID=2792007 RepID=UPI0027E2BA02|nr:alpha/beta hydrolase [Pseudonocardia sp. KRD291]
MIGTSMRLRLTRVGLRTLFGLPRTLKRLLAGRETRLEGQLLDLDLQLMNRLGQLLSSRGDEKLGEAALSAQRRQADDAAELAAEGAFDDVVTRDLRIPGADGVLDARLYVPPGLDRPSGLLVYFHGGGFVLGSIRSSDPLCRLLAAQAGVRLLSVDYRLAPEYPYPAALDDALAAYRYALDQAESLGADPDLVAVGGDSAGANLALVVAHEQGSQPPQRPAFVVALYPVTDAERDGGSRVVFGAGFGLTADYLRELERMYLPRGVPPEDTRGAIARAQDLSGMPPVYLSTAGFDPLRDEGEELAERMRAAGVPVVSRRFAGMVHGYASLTAISAAAHDATFDAASALRAGLALVGSHRARLRDGRVRAAAGGSDAL